MATPLTPSPPNPQPAQAESRHGARTAISAGLIAVAAAAAVTTTPGIALAQDDTLAQDNAWATDLIEVPAAWETTKGDGVTVAVMDTGINKHPFFEGRDILPGYTVFSDEEDAWNDLDGHGSAVAAGVLMTAPEATILPVRLDSGDAGFGGALGDAEFDAFRWAVDNGADVLVVPWSIVGERDSFTGEHLETLQYVIDKGAIIVASSGNDPSRDVMYPGFVPGVLTVTGTDSSGEVWFDNTTVGPEVEVAAPADAMVAPVPQDSASGNSELYVDVTGGTSMGAGLVGGVAALTWSAHPDLDASNVIQRLIQTSGDGDGSRNDDSGYGLVNADQAVNAEGVETVEENPLGYPMGEAGASGATPDDEATDSAEEETGPGTSSAGPSAVGAEGSKESNLSTVIVIAAAVVLVGAAIAVWLVLRGRGRKSAAAAQPGAFDSGAPTGYQPPPTPQQQYGPPQGGPQPGYGAPPPGQQGYSSPPRGQQGYNQPPAGEQQSPPWRPGDPNRR
ncbi:S8 family serine peptidase [Glycomyces paridis]|nr:S8 family serine peptidase [Glycomyces paridis]